jgi:hypothetical protein
MKKISLSLGLAIIGGLLSLVVFSGCTIATQVTPVAKGTELGKIYIEENPDILMNGLVPEIVQQINSLGFEATTYSGKRPPEAKNYLIIKANWRWDMAMYLFYFHATLYEDGRILGVAEYDARSGGANMSKFGHTSEKIRPILRELLQGASAQRAQSLAPVTH